MPLSEHEQKILSDLEESLAKQDPRFARSVSQGTVLFHARRRVRWSVAGFVLGLAILMVFFTRSMPLSLTGVSMMLCSCLVLARHAELKGRPPLSDRRRAGQ